ncbi:hypothetical protein MTR67_020837 [Solanum verrucosum]|uniref:UDP-glycosyltransferases domain-containing protein n=1 Tax=Solanum verrucosum TaxID=315347 RepID=A0AAF0QRF9_SOLVR|nr:hypothetical protein MTR67_020837 [Solanum verrucosum]
MSKLEIVMFPWFAFGRMIPYMNLSNELAKRADVPTSLESLLATAFDELYDEIKSFLQNLKPHFVFFDFAYWIPDLAREIGGIKTLFYTVFSPAAASIPFVKSPDKTTFMASTAAELVKPPPDYPSTTVVLREIVKGTNSVEEALPEGFKERVQEKGLILDCWVPQLEILTHKSVGCFVTHCGYGSMWESLALCDCQLVLLPRPFEHTLIARLMEQQLKVGVQMEKDENDLFTKENLFKSVKCVMDKDNQIGCLVKENHRKWKELLSSPGFMSNYVDNLHSLLVENT